jgi:hypothetical protein
VEEKEEEVEEDKLILLQFKTHKIPLYENRTMKPVEIVLKREEGG